MIGFANVPAALVEAMLADGVLIGAQLAASASTPVNKRRRSDGQLYRSVPEAFWAAEGRLVVFTPTRNVAATPDGRRVFSGPWRADGKVYEFAAGTTAEHKRFRPNTATGGAGPAARQLTSDPLDLLPAAIAAPLVGGLASWWVLYDATEAVETVVAYRVLSGSVHVLAATRKAPTRETLHTGTWETNLITASPSKIYHFTVEVGTRGAGLPLASKAGHAARALPGRAAGILGA
jgi:hypothetical protein